MCLILPKNTRKPKIAKKDIYCLKFVRNYKPDTGKCISYFRCSRQKVGQVMRSNIDIDIKKGVIRRGLHAIQLGSENACILPDWDATLMLAKIPKGSEYYLGKDNGIASNRMVLIEPLVTNGDFLEVEVEEIGLSYWWSISIEIMLKKANEILAEEGYEIPEEKYIGSK